jgi:hypothetical protein
MPNGEAVENYDGAGNMGSGFKYNGDIDNDNNIIKARWEGSIPNITIGTGDDAGKTYKTAQSFKLKYVRRATGYVNYDSRASNAMIRARYIIVPDGLTKEDFIGLKIF